MNVQQLWADPAEVKAIKFIEDEIEQAKEQKANYTGKLEKAEGDNIFRYILLINVSALEKYVAQTRFQAQQSFRLTKRVSLVGFVLIIVGIGLGIYSNFTDNKILEVTYLATVAGVVTEFISGVFFYLYNKTLQQLNLFHDKLLMTEQISMSLLANSSINQDTKRDDVKAELAKILMSRTLQVKENPKQ